MSRFVYTALSCLGEKIGGMKKKLVALSEAPKLALSRVEAAAALGVSPISVDRLAARGLLKPSRALRRPLYPVSEIERFLRETQGRIDP
jgi:hypothetical protein